MKKIKTYIKACIGNSSLAGLEPSSIHSRVSFTDVCSWSSSPCDHVQVISPGRSGTRWLANVLLESSNNILVCHASPKTLSEPGYLFSKGLISETEALGAYRFSRSYYLQCALDLQKCFVDLDCKNSPLAPVIADYYKLCRFIILIREPVGFIKSGLSRGYFKTKKPQAWGHLEDSEVSFTKDSEEWQIFKIAQFWKSIAVLSQSMLAKYPERTIVLRSREMFTDQDVVVKLINWLHLESSVNKISAFAKKANATRRPVLLSAVQLNLLNSLELRNFCFDGLSRNFIDSCGF